jgi:hypothetical protein
MEILLIWAIGIATGITITWFFMWEKHDKQN